MLLLSSTNHVTTIYRFEMIPFDLVGESNLRNSNNILHLEVIPYIYVDVPSIHIASPVDIIFKKEQLLDKNLFGYMRRIAETVPGKKLILILALLVGLSSNPFTK